MDFQKIKDFIFGDLFADYTTQDSLVFGVFTLAAFLLGFIISAIAAGRKKRRLRKEIKEVRHELNNTKAELGALQEQHELKTAALQKAELTTEDLSARVEILESEKSQLHTDLYNANEELERLNASNQSYASTIDDLNNQIVGLKTKNNEYSESLGSTNSVTLDGDAAAQISEMQNTYSATLDRLASLEEKLNQLDVENEMLKADLDKMKSGAKLALAEPAPVVATPVVTKIIKADKNATPLKERIVLTPAQERVKALVRKNLPAAEKNDDLTLINGVGPFLEKKLNNIGIYTYEQISSMDTEMIDEVTEAIEFFAGRIEKDDWVGQANRLLGRGGTSSVQARIAPTVKEVAEPILVTDDTATETSVEDMEAEMLANETQVNPETVSDTAMQEEVMEITDLEESAAAEDANAEEVVLGSRSTEEEETIATAPAENLFGKVEINDLKLIEGIGPKISAVLIEAGIDTWQKLSKETAESLRSTLAAAGKRYKFHNPTTWPQQAEFAAKGNWTKLKEYQDYLVGGKDIMS